MAVPGVPQDFNIQSGNQQILLTWALTAGATSYSIERSTDQIIYSVIGTSTSTQYLDTSVTLGTQYYFKIAGVNGSGTGIYSSALSAVSTPTGEMCLSQIRLASQQRADRVNSQFVTMPEWNQMINQSMYELYDLLIDTYADYYLAAPVLFSSDGSTNLFPLPNGTNYLATTPPYAAAEPFYKLMGVDLGINTVNNAWVTVNKFNFSDRNKFVYPNTASTLYGVFNLQYRVMGTNIQFIPTPTAGQQLRMWYIPRLPQLLLDTDITTSSVSGWIEYVIVDAAIKALQKEESDVSVLMAQKQALKVRIEEAAANRDAGAPDRISDVRSNSNPWGTSGPVGGFGGGY